MATIVYSHTYNVMDYGAVGDGKTDDSKAFNKAWAAVCGASQQGRPSLYIPSGKTFLLTPIKFEGPCKSSVQVQVLGDLVASEDLLSWKGHDPSKWLVFTDIKGFEISGNAKLDGRGSIWWKSCPEMSGCTRPTTLALNGVSDFKLQGLTFINSGRNHISIIGSQGGSVSSIKLIAPDESPNTDGIDISSSSYLQILDSYIGTGDDCIAINADTSFVNITKINCGPGHGISVGSLGKNGETARVEEIHVENCTFNGTQNGARIKTWQGGRGYARKISFQGIKTIGAKNPIIINQYYCDGSCETQNQSSAVQISDVRFVRIQGTSSNEEAIQLHCSQTVGCTNIFLEDIKIESNVGKEPAYSSCTNAHGKVSSSVKPPVNCLLS
ncbi:hypothetical protein SLA2020_437190 [Shorea laevis]